MTSLAWVILLVGLVNLGLLLYLLTRSPRRAFDAASQVIRDELRAGREESARAGRELREELARNLRAVDEASEKRSDALRATIDGQLRQLQEGNERKLEEMRRTVDEKLHDTLEKRLGESFKLVSERLEAVQRGLGEMQSLAAGVGDLKRVLTNVKARGTWGEVQLGALLEQILTPDQFDRNVKTRPGSNDAVEYAVRLPGRDPGAGGCVYLPIDAKFPQEDYLRLQQAVEDADAEAVARATAALARAVQLAARDIAEKYIDPPHTTDFAILFLPTEGLYAEVLRQPGLVEEMQVRQRVVPAGPTTLAAILSSLRMGFRTLAIEQRATEVWGVLAAVKTEFGKFGEVLSKVKRQLETAGRTIEDTERRTRAMQRKLRDVEALPAAAASDALALPPAAEDDQSA
jgi:DNA recombination protein RmuC